MTETLESLEQQRAALYQQMLSLGDFRPGTISVNYRKCGKNNCACAKLGHPGHGPQYLWNTTSGGKSRAQSLRLGPELEKVDNEVHNHEVFLRLCREVVQISEKICRMRPTREVNDERALEEMKKKLQRQFSKRWRRK
jgi:hypothetical protein